MYLEQLKISVRTLVVLSVLTGILYPVAITGVSQILFPRQANGSLILKDGKAVGSELIGQPFDDPKFFWGRLSATSPLYNGRASSGSNLGPLNPALTKAVQDRLSALHQADPENRARVPVDLVTASGSGLDPHISPAGALYQAGRVARKRGLSEDQVRALIKAHTQDRFLGLIGEPVVNVLELNLALDELKK
ncbi:MAG: potassium-transporting ATPase subunit KdpC [Elusimicrobiota bacterium]|jgi:K+-transporting ATPase ATPase C chain